MNLRDHRARCFEESPHRLEPGSNRDGPGIDLGILFHVVHLEEHDHRIRAGNLDPVDDVTAADRLRLAPEPSLALDGGEQYPVELFPGPEDPGQLTPDDDRGQSGRIIDPRFRTIEAEPEKVVRPESEQVGMNADRREAGPTEQLDWLDPFEPGQVELDGLCVTGEIGDDQDRLLAERSEECEDLRVLVGDEFEATPGQLWHPLPQGESALDPPPHRVGVVPLHLHVHCFVVVLGVSDDREVETLRVGFGEPRVAVA